MIIVFFTLLTDLEYCHSFLLAGIFMVISVASNKKNPLELSEICFLLSYYVSNPVLINDKLNNILCCHWNNNSLLADNCRKLTNLVNLKPYL